MEPVGEQLMDEDAVKLGLVGSEVEAEAALKWIHQQRARSMIAFLNRRLPGLCIEHKETALSQTYADLYEMGRRDELDIERPLDPLLFSMVLRKATDLLRGETRKKRTLPPEAYHDELVEAIHGGSFAHEWKALEVRELASVIMDEFREWLPSLSGRQAQVAQLLADGFPDALDPEDIHEMLLQTDHEPPTYGAVKRARAIVLEKFREMISRKYKEVLR